MLTYINCFKDKDATCGLRRPKASDGLKVGYCMGVLLLGSSSTYLVLATVTKDTKKATGVYLYSFACQDYHPIRTFLVPVLLSCPLD